ncbi:MAG: hypothetical protein ACR2F1_15195 [Nitrososphaeraceae archaeon]
MTTGNCEYSLRRAAMVAALIIRNQIQKKEIRYKTSDRNEIVNMNQ